MNKKLTRMTTSEYARARNITPQAVCKRAKLGLDLPAVGYYEMIGGIYVFYVNTELLKTIGGNKKSNKLHV